MKQLRISDDLSLPIDAATQTFAFIARKGAGKTYAAGKLAECLIDAGVQVVILDSVGNWWGLRLSADGKEAAYDIPVIGGLRGDVPLEATGGKLIADTIVETGRSLIIDVSQFSKGDRQRFATDLGERLWMKKKAERDPSPVHLIIEESQLIVPERVSGRDMGARMVGIYEEIIRLGRNFGIGVSMISQRPQSVNKEVLNQTECLVCLQVNGKHERDALKGWIVHQGMDRNLVDELPSLPIGTAYIWSPQWLNILQKVRIGQKKTFDASATPKVGTHQVRRDLKPLQLDDLKDRMAATIEKAKQDDPKELRKQIAELKRAQQKNDPDPQAVERAVSKAVADAQREFQQAQRENERAINDLRGRLDKIASLAHLNGHAPAIAEYKPVTPRVVVDRPTPSKAREFKPSGDLPIGEQKILAALIQYPNGLERNQLTTLTGYKRSTRDAYIQRLGEKGLVRVAGKVFATDEGIAALPDYEPLPTGEALQSFWRGKLPAGEWAILESLISEYPSAVDREALTETTGFKRSTRDAYLQRLASKELVITAGRGEVKASDNLFLED
jgi:hypothetical protein